MCNVSGLSNMSTIGVFISYSHKDDELRDELAKHLMILHREGIIETWYDREISAGSDWEEQIKQNLQQARIILLLISANFIASDYIWDIEVKNAMVRHRSGGCTVIPVILKPCDWMSTPFGKLQALPKGAKPISVWENRDDAFMDITQSIREIALDLGASTPADTETVWRIPTAFSSLNVRGVILFFMLLSVVLIHGFVAPAIANKLIENANFTNAVHYLHVARWPAFFNPEIPQIMERLQTPLSLHVSLIVHRVNKPFPDKPYPFDSTRDNPIVVTHKDRFKLKVEIIPDQFFLYVFAANMDNSEIKRLFPSEKNPKAAILIDNQTTLEIPPGETKWLEVQEPAEPITIHVIASPWRAMDIERIYKEINTPLKRNNLPLEEQKNLVNQLLDKILLRKGTNVDCFYYGHLSFQHEN